MVEPGAPGSAQEDAWVELIGKHGHFLHDEETYRPLRIPAAPTGRDFTFRRRRNPETGELESLIEWHAPQYDLPGLDPKTRYVGVCEVGERWEPVERRGPFGGDVRCRLLIPLGSAAGELAAPSPKARCLRRPRHHP